MKKLYCPWRTPYVKKVEQTKLENISSQDCVFCIQFAEHKDQKYFILRRFDHNVVMLNLYPYNAGHLMVIPMEHVDTLQRMSSQTRAELIEVVNLSIDIVEQTLKPEGFNVGLNLGKAAGAGIPSHLHMHVLPRWPGDTNFLPTLADTKQISSNLVDIYQRLKPAFDNVSL